MARHAEHQALALPMRPPRVPIQRWLYAEMRAAILNGRLASGQRLPTTRDLAHQFGIARGTAVAVFEQLAAEGYVTAAAGRGTHVASSLPDKLFTAVTPRTRLPMTGVRAIRLSDRARPLTVSADRPCHPRRSLPRRPTGSHGFPRGTLVPDWKPAGATPPAFASRSRGRRGLPAAARGHRRLSRNITRDPLLS